MDGHEPDALGEHLARDSAGRIWLARERAAGRAFAVDVDGYALASR